MARFSQGAVTPSFQRGLLAEEVVAQFVLLHRSWMEWADYWWEGATVAMEGGKAPKEEPESIAWTVLRTAT